MKSYFSSLTTGLLMAVCACGLKAQTGPCNDPEAWNAGSLQGPCIYIPDCGPGLQPIVFEPFFIYSNQYGSEYHLITTDLQDTLLSSTWQQMNDYFANHHAVCIDPEQCYYLDMYPVNTGPGLYFSSGPYVTIFPNTYGGVIAYYSSHPGPASKYRVSFAPDSAAYYACGILGCTDPIALNYWTHATVEYECQYCDNNSIIVGVEHAVGTGPVNYQIVQEDSVVAGGTLPASNGLKQRMHCLPDGCYELRTQGNPWFFHKLHLYNLSGDTLATVSRTQNEPMRHPFGVNAEPCPEPNTVYGCTNPLGANFNPGATMYDGSCDLQNGQCSVNLSLGFDSLSGNIQLFTNVVIGGPELIWDIKVDWGDGSPPVEATPTMTHTYAESGDYPVCVNFYTKHLYDQVPVCHAEACININGAGLGQEGGFTVGFQQVILSASAAESPAHFELYPNPAQGYFHVVLPADAHGAAYNLLTSDGRMVSTGALNGSSQRINVLHCAPGLYLFRLLWPDGSSTTRRVVIQ